MGDTTGMITLVLSGIFILAGLVSLFFSFKTWPIYTIMLLFFNLAAAVGFFYLSARTLKIYSVWGKEAKEWEATAGEMRKTADELLVGALTAENEEGKLSRDQLQLRLSNALAGRGRAWGIMGERDKPRTNIGAADDPLVADLTIEGGTLKAELKFKTEQPPVGLEPKMLVYLFIDTSMAQQVKLNGDMYLGYFEVESVNGKNATLKRIDLLEPNAMPPVGNNRPVLVYETFPNDDYRAFAGMTEAQIREMLPNITAQDVLEFTKNGQPVTEAEAAQLTTVDPAIVDPAVIEQEKAAKAAAIRYRVKMKVAFDNAAGEAQPVAPPGEDFAPAGTEKKTYGTVIPAGGKADLPIATAEELIAAGKAELDGANYRIYYRPLRDYPNGYKRDIAARRMIDQSIAETERLIALNTKTSESTEATNKLHLQKIAALEADSARLKQETALLDGYVTSLKQTVAALRARRDALLVGIDNAAVQIAQYQLETVRKINARIQSQAAAAAP